MIPSACGIKCLLRRPLPLKRKKKKKFSAKGLQLHGQYKLNNWTFEILYQRLRGTATVTKPIQRTVPFFIWFSSVTLIPSYLVFLTAFRTILTFWGLHQLIRFYSTYTTAEVKVFVQRNGQQQSGKQRPQAEGLTANSHAVLLCHTKVWGKCAC